MIKAKELRELSLDDLYRKLREIELEIIKASSIWGKNQVNKEKTGTKSIASHGEKTSIQRDLRRLKARILTVIREKEHEK